MSEEKTVVITGASGLLGRAMLRVFRSPEDGDRWKAVTGTAFSRYFSPPLQRRKQT